MTNIVATERLFFLALTFVGTGLLLSIHYL